MFSNQIPEELPIPPAAMASKRAVEVLRAWVGDNRQHVSLKPTFDDPSAWGMFLVDIARHVARAYAAEGAVSEPEALRLITEMWTMEIAKPTDPGTTEQLGDGQ